MLEIVIYIRQNGTKKLSIEVNNTVKKLWRKIEKQDTWYENDLKILNTILFTFPIEHIHLITGKILQRLEVYKNYQHLYDLRMAILLNLSTIYLYNQDKNMCKQICYTLLEDAKKKKSYDRLAICYVRIGICTDDSKLIPKRFLPSGANRWDLHAISSPKRSRNLLSTEGNIKKSRGFLDFSYYSVS